LARRRRHWRPGRNGEGMGERVAIISDIHANLEALEAVLADIDEQGVGEVLCLGDVVQCGARHSMKV